ncbi:MAG: N-acetyltransferase [Winogradskyella sp.]|nr:GNAT family N-acetyltransferase [Winogradskyella sp.]NNC46001.1 N-acetyltransferase [Winogradskyella sp.]
MIVEPLLKHHWPSVKTIYEEGLATGVATFETLAPSWAKWHKDHLSFARLVAILDDIVVGFAALSPVSQRKVYRGVAEVSIYIATNQRGKGVGKMLLNQLIQDSEDNNIWMLQASIFPENPASVALHESCGFRIVGKRKKIGKRLGKWYDNLLLERRSKKIGI